MSDEKNARPRSVSQVAQGDTGELGRINRQATVIGRLNRRLERVLPQNLAGHVEVTSIRGGTLVVCVTSPAWASRVRYAGRQLMDLVSRVADTQLGDIRIRVVPPSVAREPSARPRRLSAKAADHLSRAHRLFDDPEIQASLNRLARRTEREE